MEKNRMPLMQSMLPSVLRVLSSFLPLVYNEKQRTKAAMLDRRLGSSIEVAKSSAVPAKATSPINAKTILQKKLKLSGTFKILNVLHCDNISGGEGNRVSSGMKITNESY